MEDHPEYDTAAEVIIRSKPHKHNKMTQTYTVIHGELKLHCDEQVYVLKAGDVHTIQPGIVHWAEGDANMLSILHSRPGWTQEDHITV
ncbi:MAG: cupin domain-containing protein [Saprospiraceae bacterium]